MTAIRENLRSLLELVATVLVGLLVAAIFPAITWPAGLVLGLGIGLVRVVMVEVGRRRSNRRAGP